MALNHYFQLYSSTREAICDIYIDKERVHEIKE